MKKNKNKTNVIRLLEQHNIGFEVITYEYDSENLSVEKIAEENNLKLESVFKTLVTISNTNEIIIVVISGDTQLSLKKLANISESKKVDLVPIKDLQKLTGYIRGGCSPLGMKKQFRTFIDSKAQTMDWIYVNAGRRGIFFACSPQDLVNIAEATFADII